MPPRAMPSSVADRVRRGPPRRPAAPRARSHSSARWGGNFGASPKPPWRGSNAARGRRRGGGARRARAASAGAAPRGVGRARDLLRDLPGRVLEGLALVSPRLRDPQEERPEPRPAVAVLRREVGPGEEGLPVRQEEGRERPAAASRRELDGGHVDVVDVGSLLAVDLDRDEVLVQEVRDGRVLERLLLHHVTPVAGRVADREEDGLPLARGPSRTPLRPTDTSRPGCARAGGGRATSRRQADCSPS